MVSTASSAQSSPASPSLAMVLQARAVEGRVEEALAPLGLSLRKLGILGHLRAAPGLSFSALARRAGIKVQSLHPIVDALTASGYVRTVGEVSQGRSAALALTSEGDEVMQDAYLALGELDRVVFADGDWAVLGATLTRIAESFLRRSGAGDAS